MSIANLEPTVKSNIEKWLSGSYDQSTKNAINGMIENGEETKLTDAFYKDLEFGTGGLRGIMGIGSNRVNKYTFGMATQGFSNYLLQSYPNKAISVAIAHDNRNNSDTLAQLVANVFSANGIKVYFFDGLRPTPELSFAIRVLGCQGGVMLTASHNPKEYNGYKAYGADGGQLVHPHDSGVMNEVRKISNIADVKFEGDSEKIEKIGAEIDEQYLSALEKYSLSPDAIARQKDLKIVFSPIHGTGGVSVPPILERFGFEQVSLVEEQMVVDGNFPTVIYPNPEEKEAMTMGINKAKEIDAELVMATDPDADRVGVAVRRAKGDYMLLNGNQIASLMVHYMLGIWEEKGLFKGNEYVIKTIVTTYLIDQIAASKNVECINTLTGFKYIGEIMTRYEGEKKFLVGGEESYGYLVGEHARDKDAVISCAMIAEMTAYYKDQGSSLYDTLLDIYMEHGFYKEKLISITKKGKQGAEDIKAMMEGFRGNPPKSLGGSPVVMLKDYKSSESKNIADGSVEMIDLPSANVLQFYTEDGSIISARPSGTEPKIKFYCSIKAPLENKADAGQMEEELAEKLDKIMADLGA